jgi:hypothetical protein
VCRREEANPFAIPALGVRRLSQVSTRDPNSRSSSSAALVAAAAIQILLVLSRRCGAIISQKTFIPCDQAFSLKTGVMPPEPMKGSISRSASSRVSDASRYVSEYPSEAFTIPVWGSDLEKLGAPEDVQVCTRAPSAR